MLRLAFARASARSLPSRNVSLTPARSARLRPRAEEIPSARVRVEEGISEKGETSGVFSRTANAKAFVE